MAASLVCKVDHQGDVRRFSVDEPLSVASISSTIFKVFNLQPESTLRLVYTDRDGDNISVSSDEDLLDARAASPNQGLIRLRLMVSAPEAEAVEETTRARCWCDNCNTTIRLSDVRFKCGNCANYDLCDACESLGCHDPTHVLLKLRPEAQATNGVLPTTKAILTSPLSQLPGGVAEPPPTGGPSPAGFDLNALFTNPAIATQAAQIASMASGLVSPKTQAGAAAPKPQLDLGALAGMATSIFGSAFSQQQQQQQQQQGPRAGAPDLSNLFGALLAGANQTPSTNPAPTAETPETEDPTEDPLATLVQLGVPEDQAAQFLELAGGDVAAALNLFQQLEVD